MGRWKGATFKEYIREELHVFSEGMSHDMEQKFQFVNISGGVFHDVTAVAVASEYNTNAAAAASEYNTNAAAAHVWVHCLWRHRVA
jgi:hypothetical protein